MASKRVSPLAKRQKALPSSLSLSDQRWIVRPSSVRVRPACARFSRWLSGARGNSVRSQSHSPRGGRQTVDQATIIINIVIVVCFT